MSHRYITIWKGMPLDGASLRAFAAEVDKLSNALGWDWGATEYWLGATVEAESGWDPWAAAKNSTAVGLFQWTASGLGNKSLTRRIRGRELSRSAEYARQIPMLANTILTMVGDNQPSPNAPKKDSLAKPLAWAPGPEYMRALLTGGHWTRDMSYRPRPDDYSSYILYKGGEATKINPGLVGSNGFITIQSVTDNLKKTIQGLEEGVIPVSDDKIVSPPDSDIYREPARVVWTPPQEMGKEPVSRELAPGHYWADVPEEKWDTFVSWLETNERAGTIRVGSREEPEPRSWTDILIPSWANKPSIYKPLYWQAWDVVEPTIWYPWLGALGASKAAPNKRDDTATFPDEQYFRDLLKSQIGESLTPNPSSPLSIALWSIGGALAVIGIGAIVIRVASRK